MIEIYFEAGGKREHMVRYFTKTVIDYAICIYLVLILGVMPFYNRNGYSHIGTDKAFFFDTITVYMGRVLIVLVLIYLILSVMEMRGKFWKQIRPAISVTDLFACGYGLALVLSYLCSAYKSNALWGASGWYMGFWPHMFLILIYFFVSTLWKPRPWIFYLAFTASGVVFALGYLNRFGVNPLQMASAGPSFISTIGNINWYCGYLVSIFFAGAALLWQWESEKLWKNLLLSVYVTIGFCTLLTQGSDSGLLAFLGVLLALFCLSARDSGRMLMFWLEMALLGVAGMITWSIQRFFPESLTYDVGLSGFLITGWHPFLITGMSCVILLSVLRWRKKQTYPEKQAQILAYVALFTAPVAIVLFVGMIALNTARPGSLGPLSEYPVFTYSLYWGSHRGATWEAGWKCFVEQNFLHKLIGIGPDSMAAYISNGSSSELAAMVQAQFPNQTLTNAHSEWLTILVDIGILGLVAFGGMMVTGIWRFLREAGRNKMACACGFCLLAYTLNNLFSFQQSMSVATIFTIFGIGGALLREGLVKEQPHIQKAVKKGNGKSSMSSKKRHNSKKR